ncbi:sensor histidine kinase [Vallitalea pronyensis]|uniref:histidine kinase n=1 Tax=Vallitalea pronyensis TaxID=1348613 RepID=A0A8J8MJM4_9FIRM|nr:HAMP domain-containing sensor histidine kinase [Vallitalea pronyensis]QUI22884.1 sensor histidine kinase [Vallitalea pronyensis]
MDTNSRNKEQESMNQEHDRQVKQAETNDNQSDDAYYELNIEEGKEQLDEIVGNEKGTQKDSGRKGSTHKIRYIPRTCITFLMIILSAIAVVSSYRPIRDRVFDTESEQKRYMETSAFNREILYLTRNLIDKLRQDLQPEDEVINNTNIHVMSVKYRIIDKRSKKTLSNFDDEDITDSQIKNNPFYLHIQSNENAEVTLEHTPEISFGDYRIKELFTFGEERVDRRNKTVITMYLSDYQDMMNHYKEKLTIAYDEIRLIDHNDNTIEIITTNANNKFDESSHHRKFGDLDITYMVKDNLLAYDDVVADGMIQYMVEKYVLLILAIGFISMLIMMIIAFIIPYGFQSNIPLFRIFNKLYIEFKIGLCLLIGVFIASGFHELGFMIHPNLWFDAVLNTDTYYYAMGITVVSILFLFIHLFVVYIKYIYYEGFVNGFIKNSFVLLLLLKFFNRLKQLLSIDIRHHSTRKIILMALGSVLLLLMISILPAQLGVLLAIAVGGLLLKALTKLANDIKSLDDISAQLSEGNFDRVIDESTGGILRPITENLNRIKKGFSVAVNKATKSQKMKTELISNVSHDLKTPLTSIITYVDLLKDETLDEDKRKEYTTILDTMAKRLKVLIEDLFEASKASSGNIDIQLESLDINALFRQTLGELEEKLNKSDLIIRLNVPEEPIMCQLDGRRTYRVFENIMTNILKYAMKGSRVYIHMIDGEEEVTIIFRNTSAYEMTFDVHDITERFTRGDASRNTEGSGLGLSIAKSLVELQGGRLTIHVDGDLFKLTLAFPKEKI